MSSAGCWQDAYPGEDFAGAPKDHKGKACPSALQDDNRLTGTLPPMVQATTLTFMR